MNPICVVIGNVPPAIHATPRSPTSWTSVMRDMRVTEIDGRTDLGRIRDVTSKPDALERLRELTTRIDEDEFMTVGDDPAKSTVIACAEVLEEGRLRELDSANKARKRQDVQEEEYCLMRAETLEDYKGRLRSVVGK